MRSTLFSGRVERRWRLSPWRIWSRGNLSILVAAAKTYNLWSLGPLTAQESVYRGEEEVRVFEVWEVTRSRHNQKPGVRECGRPFLCGGEGYNIVIALYNQYRGLQGSQYRAPVPRSRRRVLANQIDEVLGPLIGVLTGVAFLSVEGLGFSELARQIYLLMLAAVYRRVSNI